MKTEEIRRIFLEFFQERGHTPVPSASLVPQGDPTLLFTNSGMVQFKDVFTGKEQRPYNMATTCQKCVRASGKHNDLEEVGYTPRHHTFFEMLGNFSFGKYFKEEAILWAWTLLTSVLKLPKDRLWITIYHTDEDAFKLWRKIGVEEERILRIATSDNFWAMGDTGPCGPCSEIFYDHGEHIPGTRPDKGGEGSRYVELWNLVFMQFEQVSQDKRINLPRPSIDTGMGIERIAAVMQGVHDNYETDIFANLIEHAMRITGKPCEGPYKIAYRVISDHIRSMCFLIADGVMPSNEGRGYVLRRILRRALRYVRALDADLSLLQDLVPVLSSSMSGFYPELLRAEPLINVTLEQEADRFLGLLERGMPVLEKAMADLSPDTMFPGDVAFRLYDTYGFPIDITKDALKQKGIALDENHFNSLMEEQRTRAREARGNYLETNETLYKELCTRLDPTVFQAYEDAVEGNAIVKSVVVNEDEVQTLSEGHEGDLILDRTLFFAECGGQVGDSGKISGKHGTFLVRETLRYGELIVHRGVVETGRIDVLDSVHITIDVARRQRICANHSATHVLQAVLREVLGAHVVQKGSFVGDDRLRFDFSHHQALSAEEIAFVETKVNALIRQDIAVRTQVMTQEEALKRGAMALFGEKYGEEVRVVTMGGEKPVSAELCGGLHVVQTGEIGMFKVISEASITSGVRRIEAVTGEGALAVFQDVWSQLKRLAAIAKTAPKDLEEKLVQLIQENSRLRKTAATGQHRLPDPHKETIGGVALWSLLIRDAEGDLRSIVDRLKAEMGSGIVLVVNEAEDRKARFLIGVTQDMQKRVNAAKVLEAVLPEVGGRGGGGSPGLAQGGGASGMYDVALTIIRSLLQSII